MKKSLAIVGTVAAVGLSSAAGMGVVSAQSNNGGGTSDLASKIAQKFSLNKDDVQKVFDDDRAQHEANRQQKLHDRLAQAVKDGKLTQAQADQLEAKLKDLQTYGESLKDKTPEERRSAMKAKMDEIKKWAEEQKIPSEYWRGLGHGHGHGHGSGTREDVDSSQ